MRRNFLFLFEPTSIESFLKGSDKPIYSHDLNLMQLAQGALANKANVYIASYSAQNVYYESRQYWPHTTIQPCQTKPLEFDFIVSANHLAFRNSKRGYSKNVLVQAAVHLIESPRMYFPAGIASYINVIQNAVDFEITQNMRMKEILFTFNQLLAGFNDPERILISQLSPRDVESKLTTPESIALRQKLNIASDAKVIINAGGAWKWTQFNEFLLAFKKCFEIYPECSLFFIQPALTQRMNSDHDYYHLETKRILESLPPNVRSRIYIGDDWQLSTDQLDSLLSIADYGLNLNLDSLEHWQSYRVRTMEYVTFNLPIIMSQGSFWDENAHKDAFIVTGHKIEEISQALLSICNETPESYTKRVHAVTEIMKELSLENQAQKTIEKLMQHNLIQKKTKVSPTSIWDFSSFGPKQTSHFGRFMKIIYFQATQNAFTHNILVILGVRALYRNFKKLKINRL